MKTLLFLDDYRNPLGFIDDDYDKGTWLTFSPIEQPFNTVWVKNYREFTEWINKNGLPDAICFDNSLGEELTGYDCAKWLVDYCLDNNIKELPLYASQSSEPHSRSLIIGLLDNFKEFNK